MKVSIKNNVKRPLFRVQVLIAGIILVSVVVTVFLGNQAYQKNRSMVLEQFNRQQLVLARTAATGIETCFNEVSAAVLSSAKISAIQNMTPDCLEYMQNMQSCFLIPRTSIRRLDEKGILRFICPLKDWKGELIGRDYGAMAYFRNARDTGNVAVSGIIIDEHGDMRIRISVPIYTDNDNRGLNGSFKGVLVVSFSPDTIARTFISPVVSGETGYAWLINHDGFFLAHYEKEFIGWSAFKVRAKRNPEISFENINRIQRDMMAGNEGTGSYFSGWHRGRKGMTEKLIAYTPIYIADQIWSVAVCAPINEVDMIMRRAKQDALFVSGFVALILTAAGIFLSITAHRWSHFLEQEVEIRTMSLRESEEKLSQIVQGSSIATFVIDGNHIVTHWNRACENLTEISATEIIGTNKQWMAFYSDERPTLADLIVDEVEEKEIAKHYGNKYNKSLISDEAYEAIHFFPDLGIVGRWLFFTATSLKRADGKIIGAIETLQDITSSREAELALHESEESYRTFFETSGDFVFITTREGQWVDVNNAAVEMLGYKDKEELLESKIIEIYENPKEVKNYIRTAEQQGFTKDFPLNFRKKDGSIINALVTSVVRKDENGNIIGYQGTIKDVTERKRLEAQLLHAQKMEAVGTLAGGIAHDFNNILQAVSGYCQLLLMRKEDNDPDRNYLCQIDGSIQRAAELIRHLLLFSRKVESKLRPVDLNRKIVLVHEILTKTVPRMVSIELRLTDNLKTINADPIQLEQIIMNLAVNARDAMPDGGRLVIETENAVLDEEYCKIHLGATPGEHLLLVISDTGHGMEKETLEHIFEPFYTTKEAGGGTGLGLATVYGIVKNHGGYITCDSEPGEGTTFRIYFPTLEDAVTEKVSEAKEAEKIQGSDETILLVDDEESILSVGSDILNHYGYTTIKAVSGEEAVEIYEKEKNRIDLVILDVGMPGMGGHKCLRKLLEIDPAVKVIITSGYSADGSLRETLKAGAAGFIGKPYQLINLLKKVREVLDSK